MTTVGLKSVDILQPFQFAGLIVGAMLPYWFSAMTMKVGTLKTHTIGTQNVRGGALTVRANFGRSHFFSSSSLFA